MREKHGEAQSGRLYRVEVKAVAYNSLKSAFSVYGQDLEALPEDAYAKKLGGVARTVADITHEICLVNDHICMVLRGEEASAWPDEGWITAPEDRQTKVEVLEAFRANEAAALATVEALTEEDMEAVVQTEHGDRTGFSRVNFMTLHLWYHSGQLNYIQTLLGDGGWHWQ